MQENHVCLGVIGCGGFGLFAVQQFAQVPGVSLAGISETQRPATLAAASRFGIPCVDSVEKLLERKDVDLVYIATPPFLHHSQAKAALEAGKHVIVEKPLALTVAQADDLIRIARKRDLLLVANQMQRYNPLFEAVRRLVDQHVLGEVLHATFENYASDENLPPEHWFWDRTKSGGIFVEHGVHFFDLLAGWLGAATIEAAQVAVRPGTAIEEAVHCTARYGESVLVNFYHGFHQPGPLDRQELRIVFERGDLTLYDWVPTRAQCHAMLDESQTRKLLELFPAARLDVISSFAPKHRASRGRGKPIDAYQVVNLSHAQGEAKSPLYCRLLRTMLQDQVAWIRDRSHQRIVTEHNGRDLRWPVRPMPSPTGMRRRNEYSPPSHPLASESSRLGPAARRL
jgi:predicted dehydrogenase